MERLGRLLSASASIFSSKVDEDIATNDSSEMIKANMDETMIQNNSGEDLMSTSDTSSHMWQGISGKNDLSERVSMIFKYISKINLL